MKSNSNITARVISDTVKYNGSNANQLMDNNSCSVLALAEAFEISYDQAYTYAKDVWGRLKRKGVITGRIIDTFNSGLKVLDKKIVDSKPITKYRQPNGKIVNRRMRISTFIKEHPKGTYYILVKGHALVIKNGVMYDVKSFADRFSRPINYAWQVK